MLIVTVLLNGTREWRLDRKLHREEGPAVIYADGSQFWYINDKCHREDGPAVIRANGGQEWFINGKYFREPSNCSPMPVIVRKTEISYDGKTFIPIGEDEYEKYKYHPTGRFTKAAQ